jgi:hypothetical protein
MLALSPTCRLELLATATGDFRGIGQVTVDGVPLRSAARPIVLRLDTPDGILYPRLELLGMDRGADGAARIRLRAHGIHWGRGEYADDYDQSIVWLAENAALIEDNLILNLEPAGLVLGGREWSGFTCAVHFHSASRRIHRLLVDATWEIGGTVTGNTVLSQGQCNMPVYRGARETLFTTACLRTLDRYGSPQANSFQLGPRGGLLQGFDFQYAPQGALLQYWSAFSSVASLLESPPGSDLLHVIDEYRFPLAADATTTPKWILFTAGTLAEHEARDLWSAAREHVYGRIRAVRGITATPVLPEIGMKYSTRVQDGRLRMNVAGAEVDSTEVPYAVAERVLPRLAAQGIRRFFPEVMSESDVTVLGLERKLDRGVHGDLHCSSVCSTHRFFPSEFWGGIKAWKHMYQKAQSLGMELGAWFAPHLSPRAPIFREHPEAQMRSITGLPAGGGYGFQTLVVADWNTCIYDWVMADLKRWKEEGGLDYLFVDSLSNMGMLQVNYAADMRTNCEALGRLVADIQRLGIRSLACECVSPWMASRFGVADLRGDLLDQDRAVAGQNDFGWWVDELDMAQGVCLMVAARQRSPEEMERACFRAMAAGGYICYENQYGDDHQLADWWSRLNLLCLQALPHMGRRRLLPGRVGIAWEDNALRTVWTFQDYSLALDARVRVEQLNGASVRGLAHNGRIVLPAWGVYRVGERA